MATTTNYGWTTPDDTDLVKDGAAAIRTLGSAVDTSFVDLLGGTTGQVLTKASNTDLDFSFTTPTTASGGMTLLSTTTLSGATTAISGISPSGYVELYLEISGITCSANNDPFFQINGVTTSTYQTATDGMDGASIDATTRGNRSGVVLIVTGIRGMKSSGGNNIYGVTITNPNSSINKNIFLTGSFEGDDSNYCTFMAQINANGVTSAISSMDFKTSSGTFSGGTVKIYGVK